MNDATNKGASEEALDDAADAIESTDAEAADPSRETMHPTHRRADVYDRFSEHRAKQSEDDPTIEEVFAAETADLTDEQQEASPEEDEHDDSVEEGDEPTDDSSEQEADPLDEYIEMVEGRPHFKTVVDGEARLVPLDRARAQLQKHEAADLRLQQATSLKRSAEARVAEQHQHEQREQRRTAEAAPAATDDVDEEALLAQASGLVESLLDEDQDSAAKKLAGALRAARGTRNAVDMDALADRVATVVEQRSEQRILAEAYNSYLKEYGETVEADPKLRAWHSAKVDELATEHPEWGPRECMMEAGRLACEFAGSGSSASTARPEPSPEPQNTEQQQLQVDDEPGSPGAETPSNPRTDRKRKLRPLPPSGSATHKPGQQPAPDNSPKSVVAEMRRRRGQPVAEN